MNYTLLLPALQICLSMDHLLRPKNPVHAPLEVPYLGNEEYDKGPFTSYLDRSDWTLDRVVDHQSHGIPADDVLTFLQRWLFFGLVHETFSELLQENDWKANSRGRTIVTKCQILTSVATRKNV